MLLSFYGMCKLLEISPLYYHMKSHIIHRNLLASPSNTNSPKMSFCSAKYIQKPFPGLGKKELSLSQRQLIPRYQSQKLQKEHSAQQIPTFQSERTSPVKSLFRKREAPRLNMQASEQLPNNKLNLDLMACSEPQLYQKTRESFSTQPPSCKSNNSFPKLREYRLLRRIGEGRFGAVYLAVHRMTGFIGAMKVLRKRGITNCPPEKREKIKAQIISQIKIQSYLNHPNLVKLYDCFADQINLYLFVELGCDGHLYGLLKKKESISQEAISVISREVTRGIAYMHTQNVLHRDIKLENIVFTHGMAKICDFGWAVYEPQELRSTLCGTPLYLAPQILKGKSYNNKVDLWALGTLVHELLTNENPFKITNQKQLRKILTEQISMTVGSPEIKSFISFVLNKNPQRRPDADIVLKHPFIKKYEQIQTCEQICCLTRLSDEEQ